MDYLGGLSYLQCHCQDFRGLVIGSFRELASPIFFCTKTRFIKSLNNQDYGMLFLSQIQVPRCSLAHEM